MTLSRKARAPRPFPAGTRLLTRMFTRLECAGRPPRFVAEFYPYANLVHTIRLRDDLAHVRFSDLLDGAPIPVLEAAAAVLLARLYRRRLPGKLLRAYRQYSLAHSTRRRVQRLRRRRARKLTLLPQGQAHNLDSLFRRLNRAYFSGALRKPRLGWSARPWHRLLGSFDPALDHIMLSSRLDRTQVPRYVVEYVLYHEMLHLKHPLRRARCGLQAHSPRFRAEERQFRHYAAARRWLERCR